MVVIGTKLGRYQILEVMGRGGMGEVYLAEDPALERKVAIKVLPSGFRDDAERRERLLREARAASALNHPNIVIVYDVGESTGSLYVAMELIEGETLRDWARRAARTPAEILEVARQAAAALQVAHDAGLVHRDLKPDNVMVRRDGLVKVLDFGLARSVSPRTSDQTMTVPGTILGTAPYMSPEQVLGQTAGPASDLFSLGTILYELLTGRHPFLGDSAVETMHRILHETPEPPSRVNRALSADFDFVFAKVLSKNALRRHASARDLDVDLETLECDFVSAPGPASSEPAQAGPRTLAVLPFKNIGGDPDLHHLGMGLADAVITRLSASPDLVVRATGAVARYQDQAVDPRLVGQDLEASVVLDASFQRAGNRLRATARLVETARGHALWADKIDVRFEDLFDVQDQVAHGIAAALTARLTARPASSGGRGGGTTSSPARPRRFVPSPEAYQRFMKGTAHVREATEKGFLAAIEEFEEAVRLEPDYAHAWANLGSAYHGLTDGGFRHEPIWYEKAEAALARAIALDPEDGHARQLAAAQHVVHGRKREAYAELIEAIQRAPHFFHIYHYLAYLFRLCDMLEEAIEAERRAIELEPNLKWAYGGLARCLILLGRHEEAATWRERLHQRSGGRSCLSSSELFSLVCLGRFREILEGLDSKRFQNDEAYSSAFAPAFAHLKVGDRVRAAALLERFEPMAFIDMDAAGHTASYYAHAGDPDRAFLYLERAAELGLDTLRLYENEALFAPLHPHPRWSPFIEGVRARVAEFRREFHWPPA